MADNMDKILGVLADRFGTTVEHLWGVLVLQAYVWGVQAVVWAVLSALTIVACALAFQYAGRKRAVVYAKQDGKYHALGPDEDTLIFSIGVSIAAPILAALAAIVFVVNIMAAVSYLINPEYAALQHLLGILKK